MKVFNYFISYFFTTKEFNFGIGNCNNSRNKPIKTIEDIQEVEKLIQENFGLKEVKIMSYKVLNCEKGDGKYGYKKQ